MHQILLESTHIGHLGTSDLSSNPRVVPVCFVEFSGNIYSVIDAKPKISDLKKLKRVQNIISNSNVSFLIDHYSEDWDHIWYLQINGEASIINEPQTQMHQKLINKYYQYSVMDISEKPLIQIVPKRINMWGNINLGVQDE